MADYADYQFSSGLDEGILGDQDIAPHIKAAQVLGATQWRVLHKQFTFQPPDADAELRVNFTDLFDGVATPIILAMDSSDNVQDKAAGTGVHTAKILAITPTDMVEETYIVNGTTVVDGTGLYTHVNDERCVTYGSGGKPTGAIKVINNADNKVYATIAADDLCSINARTYIPNGWKFLVLKASAWYNDTVASATGKTILEGCAMRWIFVTTDTNPEIATRPLGYRMVDAGAGKVDITPPKVVRNGGNDVYVTLNSVTVHTDLNPFVNVEYTILMWK